MKKSISVMLMIFSVKEKSIPVKEKNFYLNDLFISILQKDNLVTGLIICILRIFIFVMQMNLRTYKLTIRILNLINFNRKHLSA